MIFPRDPYEPLARAETRQGLLATGIPLQFVDEIVELGFDAAHLARAKLHEKVFTAADERVAITALGVALSVAMTNLQTMQAAMIEAAGASGRPVKHFTVGGDHGRDH